MVLLGDVYLKNGTLEIVVFKPETSCFRSFGLISVIHGGLDELYQKRKRGVSEGVRG